MKKFLASILMLLYLSASGAVVLNVHYCMGEVSSVKIGAVKGDECAKCGMPEDSNSCCRSELEVIKVHHAYQAPVVVFNVDAPVSILPTAISLMDVSKLVSNNTYGPLTYRPPIDPSPDLNILNCIFRI